MTMIDSTYFSSSNQPLRVPAGVKIETAEQEQAYRSAVEFERFFVQELLKPMQSMGSLLGDDDESAGIDGYRDMAHDQLTQAVLDGGGLGLAATLYQQLADALNQGSTDHKDGV